MEILFVEDNPSDADLAMRVMQRDGLQARVRRAKDGVAALVMLFGTGQGEAPTLPSVVFLDLKLPKIGGLEVLQRMRADPRTRSVPVVVLTSSREDRDLKACYSAGANSYVVKPVNFEQYSRTLADLRRYWLEINVLPA